MEYAEPAQSIVENDYPNGSISHLDGALRFTGVTFLARARVFAHDTPRSCSPSRTVVAPRRCVSPHDTPCQRSLFAPSHFSRAYANEPASGVSRGRRARPPKTSGYFFLVLSRVTISRKSSVSNDWCSAVLA